MFSLFAKITKRIAQYPKAIIAVLAILGLLCIYPINHLRWEIQLQDVLKGNEVQTDVQKIEDAFGGLGSLTVILSSGDSLANYELAHSFAETFARDSLVHFIDYTADVDFFKKNRLLYASEDDLDKVIESIEETRSKIILQSNPFFVSLDSTEENLSNSVPKNIIEEIEAKYFKNLQQGYSNQNGTIRIIDIYPTKSLTDLKSNRELYASVAYFMKSNAEARGIKVLYTGEVYDSVRTGKKLLPEAKIAGGFAALIILILLILHFYKQPQLIAISALPMALPAVFTLALTYLIFGRICLFTLPLALLLPGHACQINTHVLARYFKERQNNLGPVLSVESAILGIIPTVAASSLIMAALFASLIIIPLPGLREFGVMGAIGTILNLTVCPLLSTSLLQFLQRKKTFSIMGTPYTRVRKIKLLPNAVNWVIIITLSIISLSGILYSGNNLKFRYDFKKMDIQHNKAEADSLISETGFSPYDPVIIMLPDSSYNDDLLQDISHLQERGVIPDIEKVFTQYQFMPKLSKQKSEQVQQLKKLATPEVLSRLSTSDSANIVEMLENYDSDVKDFELSENIRRKFSDRNGNSGVFAFIIPSSNSENGLYCRHVTSQIRKLEGVQDKKFKVYGTPILRASVLDAILANLDKSIFLGTILLWIILLLYYNKLSRAFFTILPALFSMSWLTITIHFNNIHLSAYSSLAYILLIGTSVDGSLQLWAAYYEKQRGTALTVLQNNLSSIIVAQLATFIGTFALLFSSHPGIRSMGEISLIGLVCIFISQFTIFPLIAGTLDQYRVIKKIRLRHGKTSLH